MKIDKSDIRNILKSVFTKSIIPDEISNLKIGDVDEWDSLGNFNFLLEVENFYGIRFEIDEISEIKSVQDVISYLENS